MCFRWKYSPDNLSLCFTRLPSNPEEQTHITAAGTTTQSFVPLASQIGDGDIVRLFTDDPARLPLPHLFLLSLHSVLWELIGSAGLGETAQEKSKRLQRPAGHGDSDDSNDNSRPMSRKGTKRNKTEGRGKDGPKQEKQRKKNKNQWGMPIQVVHPSRLGLAKLTYVPLLSMTRTHLIIPRLRLPPDSERGETVWQHDVP